MTESVVSGRYRIERTLGRGAMAVVYLARDEELHRHVAIKILSEQLGADQGSRARFLREARLASRLSHPNVVQVYDANAAGARLFIVMEYVAGSTLAKCGTLPADEAVDLALQACAGLQHAHAAGLVHRDVKPANLLLREDGVLKVADFGIARAADTTQLTSQGTILGTAAYLAPEQAAGDTVGTAADIYSLGAVLYELLTGRPPYRVDSLAELAEVQSAADPITPPRDLEPSIPTEVEAAVMHALARESCFRPASAADFAQELAGGTREAQTEPLPAPAFAGSNGTRGYRRIPRKLGWALVAVALLALAAAVVPLTRRDDGSGTSTPPQSAPVSNPPRGATPADGARSLSAWLRAHSR